MKWLKLDQPSGKSGWIRTFSVIMISLTLILSMSAPISADSLAISTTSLDSGEINKSYSEAVEASGGTEPYTWEVTSGSLPDGLSLSATTGSSINISGTPEESGTSSFTIKVTDSSDPAVSDTKSLSITIYDTVTISTIVLRPGAEDMEFEYSQTLEASGGSGDYTWTKTSGTLPSGLSLSDDGEISGTPSSSGDYTFTVKATDSDDSSASDTQELSIRIKDSGYLSLWGDNSSGQIGNDSTTDAKWPVQPDDEDDADVVDTASGGLHTIMTDINGDVYAWGENGNGQLGIDSSTDKHTPEEVDEISDILAVAAGYKHSLALDKDGNVYAWGYNSSGELGIGSTSSKDTPQQIEEDDNGDDFTDIVAIAAGYSHSLALKSDGTVWAWGDNSKGQLGIGSITDQDSPVQVKSGDQDDDATYLTNIVAIAAGYYFNLALDAEGNIWAWGSNSNGELGNNSSSTAKTPVEVDDIDDITAIAAGAYHSLAVDDDGVLYAWGDNSNGQLGIDDDDDQDTPQEVEDIEDVEVIAAGCYHSLAVDEDENVWTWGDNSNGQLGIGSTTDKDTPEQVEAFDENVFFVAAFGYNSIALSSDEPEEDEDDDDDDEVTIDTEELDSGTKGESYSQTLEASGGSGDYTWSKTSGTLPTGLSLKTSTGKISGTPTKTGSFTFKVKAVDDDDDDLYDTATFTIKIYDESDTIEITTASLTEGTAGTAYSQTLKATGGSGDYTWSKASGTLPTGLTLNSSTGKISGTPTSAGDYSFDIKVVDTDDTSLKETASFTITIKSSGTSSAVSISGFNSSATITLSSSGATQDIYQLTSTDGNLSLLIPSGSKLLDSNDEPLTSLTVSKLKSLPESPKNGAVIAAYSFEPEGASFSSSLTATIKYSDSDIPSGGDESLLYLASYEDSQWVKLSSMVDEGENTVSAKINHFSTYGLILTTTTTAAQQNTQTTQATPAQSGQNQQSPQSNEPPAKSVNWWLIIAIIFAVIIIALVLIVVIRRRQYGN